QWSHVTTLPLVWFVTFSVPLWGNGPRRRSRLPIDPDARRLQLGPTAPAGAPARLGADGTADAFSDRLPGMVGRIVIEAVRPVVDCGRWPARAGAGQAVPVQATIYRDGHVLLGAAVQARGPGAPVRA